MLEGGAPTSEAAAWVDSQADVAEVMWDDTAIWFRPGAVFPAPYVR